MLYGNKFNVLCHFSILNDIVILGSIKSFYFICLITKLPEKFKKTKYIQNEANIYIKDNDGSYYSIQVTLVSRTNKSNKPLKVWFLELLEEHVNHVYTNIKNNSSKINIKGKNKFSYNLYNIPAYIWCIATGMISAEL
jgi:hypothetical protein